MRVFISYHRADTKFRHKLENILNNFGIDYYAVPEDADFNGKKPETIKTYICNRVKQCDILLCLIGKDTYRRPHIDREIHTALKGAVGIRLGILAVILPTRSDNISRIDVNSLPVKLWQNKDYVVWCNYEDLNSNIISLLKETENNANNKGLQTNHTNPCMPLRTTTYYDN